MTIGQDISLGSLVIAFLNFAAAIMNLYFGFVVKKSQAEREIVSGLKDSLKIKANIIQDLTTQMEKKEKAIDELMKSKTEYKNQYLTEHSINQKIQGSLDTYVKFHGHDADGPICKLETKDV